MGKYGRHYCFVGQGELSENEIRRLSLFDVVSIDQNTINPANGNENVIEKLHAYNGNQKILLYFNTNNLKRSGYQGVYTFQGQEYPYYELQYVVENRVREEAQYVITSTGTPIQTTTAGYENAYLPDLTLNCPKGSDGKNLVDWLADFLVTGGLHRFDIDGFFLDELHFDNSNWFGGAADIDLNRDGTADSSSQLISAWTSGMRYLTTAIRDKIGSNYLLCFNGNATNYNQFDFNYYEAYPGAFVGRSLSTATGIIGRIINSGCEVICNYWTEYGDGTTFTGFTPSSPLGHSAMSYYQGTALLLTGTYFNIDSGYVYHSNIWYVESSFKSYQNPLTEIEKVDNILYRLYMDGLVMVNTGILSQTLWGISIPASGSIFIDSDIDRDFRYGNDALAHGFSGVVGTGFAKHRNDFREFINAILINKIELSVDNLSDLILGSGNYGQFRFDASENYYLQILDIDNREKTLKKGLDRDLVVGYSISGVTLTDMNPDTRLFYRVDYPETASGYMWVIYQKNYGSRLGSASWLGG